MVSHEKVTMGLWTNLKSVGQTLKLWDQHEKCGTNILYNISEGITLKARVYNVGDKLKKWGTST